MVLCVCKCLNVSLECDKIEENVDIGKLKLTPLEQRDIFFSEKLLACLPNNLKTQVLQQALVGEQSTGRCTLHSCLACNQTVYAILQDSNGLNIALLLKSLQTSQDRINMLKKSNNYSPVFNLLVPEVTNNIDMKENMDTNNLIIRDTNNPPVHQAISTLSKHMKQTLESQLESVEEIVTQFREQKYAEYEAYRERAQRDHKILASIISKARVDNNSWKTDSNLQNGPPSPQLPPLQRRRLSSIKDAKKNPQNIHKANRTLPSEDDSLDAEDLFDLEGMDSRDYNDVSDVEDYYSDQGSNDEGIQMSRPRGGGGGGGADIARSLPMNMPRFPNDRNSHRDDGDEEYEGPQDIAASIKALARSVHGDVFELPRPRFSTQI